MRRSPSITWLLTTLFAAAAFVMIGAASIALYLELKRELASRRSEELAGKMELIRHLATEAKGAEEWKNLERIIDDIVIGHGGLRVWIGARGGGAIYGARRMPEIIDTGATELIVVREDGVRLVGLASPLAAGDLVVALDDRDASRTLAEFRLALALVTLAAVIAAALLGALVSRRGLAPVRNLARETASIRPSDLTRRLDVAPLPAELRELGGAFNTVLDRLQLAYRQMDSFNSDVAHELRTPLANLITATELALAKAREPDYYRETLASNLEELERLKSMVNDMLFLARADQGDRAERKQPVEIAAEADKVLEYYEPAMDEARVHARVEGSACVPADVGLVRRALSNLVSNAIRHTAPGHTIEVRLQARWGVASVSVRNPGPPIDPTLLPRLFDRFSRADTARNDLHYGLGLAIVKAIARMHGGEVFAKSEAGHNEIGMRIPLIDAPIPQITET